MEKDERIFILEKNKTALIIVDMQNEFVRDGGKLQVPESRSTIDANKRILTFFRKRGMPVIYTRIVNRFQTLRKMYSYIRKPSQVSDQTLVPGHMRYFSDVKKTLDVTDIIEEVYPQDGDYVIVKDYYDAFHGTELDVLLRSLHIRYVVVTGTDTHICVGSTAKSALSHNYGPVLVSDAISSGAVGTVPEVVTDLYLRYFALIWGRVMTSEQIFHELSG